MPGSKPCLLKAPAVCFFFATLAAGSMLYGQPGDVPIIAARHLFDLEAQFLHPSDVAVGLDGRIYVLDGVNNRVVIFTPAGKFVSAFGVRGRGKGGLNSPLGLDIDKDGSVYVADSGNRLIQVFGPTGQFRFEFPVNLQESARPADPVDVVLDESKDRCYVIDNDNHRILVYSRDGSRYLKFWGGSGEKPGEFQFPFLAALDNQSTLYVVDVLNTRVQALNEEGRAMAYMGKWGVDRGQFYRPKGVTVDKKDRIYVSDSYLGVVQVFERFRKFLGVLGDEQRKMLRFSTPVGITIDDDLRLYVVEMELNRVSVYQLLK
jgi:DNA-binding beta-propeller fold protein YncE